MAIENELAEERSVKGWSQAEVAEMGGISRQSYSAIESGKAVPSTEIALRLAAAFGRTVDELFQLPDVERPAERARWIGRKASHGRRVRLARVGGMRVALDDGQGGPLLGEADGVVVAVDGSDVVVRPFALRPPEAALVAVGCDPAFGIPATELASRYGFPVCWNQRGSRDALEALGRGEAHIAGVHLRDPSGGDFNGEWVRRLVPFPCTRITFAVWEQGLVVGAGNPRSIQSVIDLARPDLRYLNREVGSGSRQLLDRQLSDHGMEATQLLGYQTAARSHLAVAEGVASGAADAGIAIRAAAQAFGLDLVSIALERYELVIPNHFLDLPAVMALLDLLKRPGIRAQVEALGGYDAAEIGVER